MSGGAWERYRAALAGEPLPLALVDLGALDANTERLTAPVRAGRKRLRIATKSVRSPDLLRYIAARLGDAAGGFMTYSAAETAYLAELGFRDLLLAYPTMQPADLRALCAAAERGAGVTVVVDDERQVGALSGAAERAGVRVGVAIEVDVSYRPAGGAVHIGVWRSPIRSARGAVALAERVGRAPGLELRGVMAYEAQIAGLPDESPFAHLSNAPKRLLKRLSRPQIRTLRGEVVSALAARGLAVSLVNGGGTGSIDWSATDDALTEVTAGSGFLASHLFDYFRGARLEPAAFFALQVVRRPAADIVTCLGGGYVASGPAGADRLPRPWLPGGLSYLPHEAAGEVQTPLRLRAGTRLDLGDPVFFRHAKAGELAERFPEYLLVRGDRVEGRARTYRGLGQCFG